MIVNYRQDIDGLRAIAVLLVLFYHVGFDVFSGGYVGVDVFFVISGYLITGLIRREVGEGTFSFVGFYTRRARRLLPALYATFLFCLLAGFVLLAPHQMQSLGRTLLSAALSISNFLFWSETDYFDESLQSNPLLHTWSLSVEEQFYFLWPLVLVAMLRRPRGDLVAPFVLTGACVASLVAAEVALSIDEAAAFYLLPFRIFELALGGLMVWAPKKGFQNRLSLELIAFAGFAMILWAAFSYDHGTRFPGTGALLPCVGSLLLLRSGESRWVGGLLRAAAIRWLGRISYSLYLIHWPLIVFHRSWMTEEAGPLDQFALVAGSIAAAAAMYAWIEQPFRHGPSAGTRSVHGERRVSVGNGTFAKLIIIFLLATVAPALHAFLGDGWEWRRAQSESIDRLLSGRAFRMPELPQPDAPVASIAVIGDSHSQRIAAGLASWADERRVDLDHYYFGGGCPPLLGISVFGNAKQSRQCEQVRDQMLSAVLAEDYDIVIIVARWGLYTGKVTPEDTISPRFIGEDFGTGNHHSIGKSRAAFGAGLDATRRALQAGGARVVFMGQVPPVGPDPFPCIARQPDVRSAENVCAKATYAQVLEEAQWATSRAIQIASDTGMHVIDPVPLFCPSGRCMLSVDGNALYSDGNHLSNYGARFASTAVVPVLERLLSKPGKED